MDELFATIKRAVEQDRIVFSIHADNQLASRDVVRWQVVAGFYDGEHLMSVPHAKPNPKILMRQSLSDGSAVTVIWSYLQSINKAKVVTVFFDDSR